MPANIRWSQVAVWAILTPILVIGGIFFAELVVATVLTDHFHPPPKGLLLLVAVPAAVAGVAVLARTRGRTVQWLAGAAISCVPLSFGWLRIGWRPSVPLAPFFVSLAIPVVTTFWVASQKYFRPATAFLAAMAAFYAGLMAGILSAMMLGIKP